MAWSDSMLVMLRVTINDLDSGDYTYSDDQLKQMLVVAAKYVVTDISLPNSYTINVVTPDISPDPATLNDDIFIDFVVLKAACLLDQAGLRSGAAIGGVKAVLGPATLDVDGEGKIAGYLELIKQGPCKLYSDLKKQYGFMGANSIRAVISPFVSNLFDPRNLRIQH